MKLPFVEVHALPFSFTGLPTGQYVLMQVPSDADNAADLDIIIGQEIPFVVGTRAAP